MEFPGALLDAEAKIGEMLKELPKQPRIENIRGCTTATSGVETKESAVQRRGFEKTQAHRFEVLADNPDVIEQVKAEAVEWEFLSSEKPPGEVLLPVRVKPSGDSLSNQYYLQDTTSIGLCELELKRIYEVCYPETRHGAIGNSRVPESGTLKPRYIYAPGSRQSLTSLFLIRLFSPFNDVQLRGIAPQAF